jgi:hypothetical protein
VTSDIDTKYQSTFRDLELQIEAHADRNLNRILKFIIRVLGVVHDDNLAPFFAVDSWPDTKSELWSHASKHWTKKSTLQSELSRITKVAQIAQDLLTRSMKLTSGEDPEYLNALLAIRTRMKDLDIDSFYLLEQAAHGTAENDLPPAGPSFITRVCRLDLGIRLRRLAQARRARSPQIAQALGALAAVFCSRAMSVA